MSRVLLLASCLLLSPGAADAQTTVPVGVFSAYLHVDPADLTSPAAAIDLGALGLVPGYTIGLETAGEWDAGPGGDEQVLLLAVFSGDGVLLGPTFAHRVPGAIDAGIDNFSGGTWPSGEPTDIAEDFTVSRPGIEIVIPPGASFLFVTPADIYYRDNGDPDADLGVTITLLSTVAVPAGGAGSPRLALAARPNPFTAESSIAFRLAEASTVQMTIHDAVGRRVRTVFAGRLERGDHVVHWDGRDASGRRAPAGTYFAQLTEAGAGAAGTTRLILVR